MRFYPGTRSDLDPKLADHQCQVRLDNGSGKMLRAENLESEGPAVGTADPSAVRAAEKTRARAKSRPSGELVFVAWRVSRRYWCRGEKKSSQPGPIAQMTSELLLNLSGSITFAGPEDVSPPAG